MAMRSVLMSRSTAIPIHTSQNMRKMNHTRAKPASISNAHGYVIAVHGFEKSVPLNPTISMPFNRMNQK